MSREMRDEANIEHVLFKSQFFLLNYIGIRNKAGFSAVLNTIDCIIQDIFSLLEVYGEKKNRFECRPSTAKESHKLNKP